MKDPATEVSIEEDIIESFEADPVDEEELGSESMDFEEPGTGKAGKHAPSHSKEKMKKPMRMATQNRRQHHENPNIFYMNGDSLARPIEMSRSSKRGAIVLAIIAAIIGIVFLFFYFDSIMNEPVREQERLEESIKKEVTLGLPNLVSFVELDDAAIDASLKETGATFFEKAPVGSGTSYEIIKLPADVSLTDAAVMYSKGISKLSAVQAATLLNGAWDLSVDRTSRLNISLHYADFKSGTVRSAIQNAIIAEGLDHGEELDSGDDDGFGNAYSSGKIVIEGEEYNWRVSAIPLSKVYSVAGLPEDIIYVGVRITS